MKSSISLSFFPPRLYPKIIPNLLSKIDWLESLNSQSDHSKQGLWLFCPLEGVGLSSELVGQVVGLPFLCAFLGVKLLCHVLLTLAQRPFPWMKCMPNDRNKDILNPPGSPLIL